MPAKDLYHDTVRVALTCDGWTITHDPYTISIGRRDVYVDLGAEQTFAAEKEGRRIAVEVKTFRGPSDLRDLEQAVGQFVVYRIMMSEFDPDRVLYLAVSDRTYDGILQEPIGSRTREALAMPLVVFRPEEERIVRWIPSPNTAGSSGT